MHGQPLPMQGHMYVCVYVCIYARNSCICRVMSFWALSAARLGQQASYAGVTLHMQGHMYVCMYVCIYARNSCIASAFVDMSVGHFRRHFSANCFLYFFIVFYIFFIVPSYSLIFSLSSLYILIVFALHSFYIIFTFANHFLYILIVLAIPVIWVYRYNRAGVLFSSRTCSFRRAPANSRPYSVGPI
jgi:hypothetical protein